MSRTLSSKYYELCHIHITNRSKWSIELCGSRHAECLGPLTVGFDILKTFYSAKSSVLSNFEEFVLSNFEEFVLSNFEEFVLSNSAEFDILSDSTEFDSSFDRMSWLRCRFLFFYSSLWYSRVNITNKRLFDSTVRVHVHVHVHVHDWRTWYWDMTHFHACQATRDSFVAQ